MRTTVFFKRLKPELHSFAFFVLPAISVCHSGSDHGSPDAEPPLKALSPVSTASVFTVEFPHLQPGV